jgi:hypothetical protein
MVGARKPSCLTSNSQSGWSNGSGMRTSGIGRWFMPPICHCGDRDARSSARNLSLITTLIGHTNSWTVARATSRNRHRVRVSWRRHRATAPAGKLQMHIPGAIAELERARIAERVKEGLQRAKTQGKRLRRPRCFPAAIAVPGSSVRDAARIWGVSMSTAARWRSAGRGLPSVV